MGLRDILKKKDGIVQNSRNQRDGAGNSLQTPEFTFVRSDTHTQEVIHPPSDGTSMHEMQDDASHLSASDTRPRCLSEAFRPNRSSRNSSVSSSDNNRPSPVRRLSQRLHLSRSPVSSENVPANLPEIVTTTADPGVDKERTESQWEKRATLLAQTANENEALQRNGPVFPIGPSGSSLHPVQDGTVAMRTVDDGKLADLRHGVASTPAIDADIQEAIRLHEEGDLRQSTKLFGVLADPSGANNPLSQVLYGLALR